MKIQLDTKNNFEEARTRSAGNIGLQLLDDLNGSMVKISVTSISSYSEASFDVDVKTAEGMKQFLIKCYKLEWGGNEPNDVDDMLSKWRLKWKGFEHIEIDNFKPIKEQYPNDENGRKRCFPMYFYPGVDANGHIYEGPWPWNEEKPSTIK